MGARRGFCQPCVRRVPERRVADVAVIARSRETPPRLRVNSLLRVLASSREIIIARRAVLKMSSRGGAEGVSRWGHSGLLDSFPSQRERPAQHQCSRGKREPSVLRAIDGCSASPLHSRLRETSAKVAILPAHVPLRRRPGSSLVKPCNQLQRPPIWAPACAGAVSKLSQRSRLRGNTDLTCVVAVPEFYLAELGC